MPEETRIYSVTVRAFDRISTRNIHAVDAEEAREKALEAVHFKVTVSEPPRAEWVKKQEMAEVAEAVGTTTELVMAVHSSGIVLYTPEGTEEIWSARLDRDADGILVAGPGRFMATFEEFHARAREGIDAVLREMEDKGELPPRNE